MTKTIKRTPSRSRPKAVAVAPKRKAAGKQRAAGRVRAEKKKQTATELEVSRRPGGRTERNRLLVANAVLQLVENGNLDFELQEVAAISGLHRTTIFRRWPDRESLIAAALSEHLSHFTVKTTGNWQIDLRRIAFALRDFFLKPAELAMNRLLLRTANEEFRNQVLDMWAPLIKSIENTLVDAQREGEVSQKVDHKIIVGMMSSTLMTQTLLGLPCDDDYIERLVGQLIRCCR